MCCKPGPPPSLPPPFLVQCAEGYRLSSPDSLTDFSVEGNRQQTGVRQRYVCTGARKEA